MRWLLFLSRLAFICGISFVISISLVISNWKKDDEVTATIIIIGYILGAIVVTITNICYVVVLFSKKKLNNYIPRWLAVANFIFLLLLLYYIFYLNDHPNN